MRVFVQGNEPFRQLADTGHGFMDTFYREAENGKNLVQPCRHYFFGKDEKAVFFLPNTKVMVRMWLSVDKKNVRRKTTVLTTNDY